VEKNETNLAVLAREGQSLCTCVRAGQTYRRYSQRRAIMSLGTILLIILILILLGALPTWPYSSGWGYYPSGGIGLILVIVLILVLLGRI
jgi:Protein of unknown function (DUF3309)